jgi:hypothetical protein
MSYQLVTSKAPWHDAKAPGSNESYHHAIKPEIELLHIHGHKIGAIQGRTQHKAAKPARITRTNHLTCPFRQSNCFCVLLEGVSERMFCLNPHFC